MVPQDLPGASRCGRSVDMVRVTMEFFEEVVPLLARNEEQLTALTAGILRYSRDLAFAAATAYADAGRGPRRVGHPDGGQHRRRRGARRHRPGTAVPGRGAELGRHRAGDRHRRDCRSPTARTWPATTSTTIVGRHGRAALSDVHGTWLVAIVSGPLSPDRPVPGRTAERLRRRPGGHRADRADA